jgi:hypothetical protein
MGTGAGVVESGAVKIGYAIPSVLNDPGNNASDQKFYTGLQLEMTNGISAMNVYSQTYFGANSGLTKGLVLTTDANSGQLKETAITTAALNALPQKWTQPFQLTASGTNITVGPGVVSFDDGTSITFNGGTIACFATNTDYIVLNYATTNLHCLRQYLAGDGELLLGTVVMGASGPTSINMPASYAPNPSRLGGFLALQKQGTNTFPTVVVAGDSTVQSPRDTGPIFWNMLFNTTYASSNLNVAMAANVNLLNYAQGGTSPQYTLAEFSTLRVPGPVNAVAGWQGYGWTGGAADAFPVNTTPYVSDSWVYSQSPDLVIMGSGINGADSGYNRIAMENLCRELVQFHNYPTILLTQHDLMTAGSNTPPSYYSEAFQSTWAKALHQGLNVAVADTWGYVDEANMRGNQTTYDGTHQNNLAQYLWAEAIAGVIANRSSQAAAINPPTSRILPPVTASEYTRMPYGSYVVVKPSSTSGTVSQITTSSMYAGGSNAIPFVFGYPNGGIGATTTGYQISSGGIATYCSEAWTAARVLIERTGAGVSSGTFSYLDVGSTSNNLGFWTYNDSSAGDFPGELFEPYTITPSQIAGSFSTALVSARNASNGVVVANLGLVGNGGLAISVTNGVPLKVLGVMFYGPHRKEITLTTNNTDALTFTGNWALGPDPHLYPQVLSTDDAKSSLRLKFKGNGAYFNVRCNPAGGTITTYLDGALYNTYSLASPGRPPVNLYFWPTAATKDLTRGYGDHEVLIQYNGPITGNANPPARFGTATATVNAAGSVTGVTGLVAGQGYASSGVTPIVTLFGGGGVGATANATNATTYPSGLSAITILNGGSFYTNAPTVYVEGGLHGLTITKITVFSP